MENQNLHAGNAFASLLKIHQIITKKTWEIVGKLLPEKISAAGIYNQPLQLLLELVKNGHDAQGQQQHWCKDCNKRAVLHHSPRWSGEKKEAMIGTCHERPGMRGISRMFGISRQPLASRLKNVLESDEMRPFVLRKADQCRLRNAPGTHSSTI